MFYTGGRPANWTDISTECLFLIESLTNKLLSEVSLQAQLQQPPLDPKMFGSSLTNGYVNGHANGLANGNTGNNSLVDLHDISNTCTGFYLGFIVWGKSPEWLKAKSFQGGPGGHAFPEMF